MTKRDAVEVAVKIIGLYSLFTFAINIVGQANIICTAFGLLAVGHEQIMANPALYIVLCCLSPLVQLVFALVFLRGGRRIAEMLVKEQARDSETQTIAGSSQSYFPSWIRILGLYFFVSAIVQLAGRIGQVAALARDANWQYHIHVVAPILQLVFSVVLIFKARNVADLIGGTAEPSAGGNAAPPRASA